MKRVSILSVLLVTGIFAVWCLSCSSGNTDTPVGSTNSVEEIESAVEVYALEDDVLLESQLGGSVLPQHIQMAAATEGDDEAYDEEYEEGVDDDETYYEDVESDEDEDESAESDDDEELEYEDDEDAEDYEMEEDSTTIF